MAHQPSSRMFFVKSITYVISRRTRMTFSQKVKYVRKKLGYTQAEFAKALGVSFATVNRWENGQVFPSALALRSFRDFCEDSFIDFPNEE